MLSPFSRRLKAGFWLLAATAFAGGMALADPHPAMQPPGPAAPLAGMPPVVDPANLYSEISAGHFNPAKVLPTSDGPHGAPRLAGVQSSIPEGMWV